MRCRTAEDGIRGGSGGALTAPSAARQTNLHPIRQWPGVHRQCPADLAEEGGDQTDPDLSWQPLGEGYNERFNGTLRTEVLNAEWFSSFRQPQTVIDKWMQQYNHIRPHQALNMRPPVPETLSETGP